MPYIENPSTSLEPSEPTQSTKAEPTPGFSGNPIGQEGSYGSVPRAALAWVARYGSGGGAAGIGGPGGGGGRRPGRSDPGGLKCLHRGRRARTDRVARADPVVQRRRLRARFRPAELRFPTCASSR